MIPLSEPALRRIVLQGEDVETILRGQIQLQNPTVFNQKRSMRPVRKATLDMLAQDASPTIPLDADNPIIAPLNNAYESLDNNEDTRQPTLELLSSILIPNSPAQALLRDEISREILIDALEINLREFPRRRMDTIDIPMLAHSLHVTQCVGSFNGALQTILAALGHDLFEDTTYAKERGGTGNRAQQYFEELRRGGQNIDDLLIIATASIISATKQSWVDYHTYLSEAKNPKAFSFRALSEKPQLLQDVPANTLIMKLGGDKTSASMTLEGYTLHKKLKHYGKVFSAIMVAEEYLREGAKEEEKPTIRQAITTLAYHTVQALNTDIYEIKEQMKVFSPRVYQNFLPNKTTKELDKLIETGFLYEYTPKGILYNLLAMGYSTLKTSGGTPRVSPLLKRVNETDQEAAIRIHREQELFKGSIKDYHFTTSHRQVENNRIRSLKGAERELAKMEYQRILGLQVAMRAGLFAAGLDPQHYFRREGKAWK